MTANSHVAETVAQQAPIKATKQNLLIESRVQSAIVIINEVFPQQMKDWLRKRLDGYELRRSRRDDEFAELVGRGVDAMSHRPTLNLFVYFLVGLDLIYWASVLLFPYDVLYAMERVFDLSEKIVAVVICIVFGTGLWLTYALFRLKFSDLEDANSTTGVMSAFVHQEHSYRRSRVWLVSVVGGVLNLLALVIIELILVGK